jgi:hypothetical protein
MIDYSRLKEPFANVHFRPKTCYNGKVLLLAYLDGRDVMDRLDEVVGPDKWECDYKEIKNNLYCGISVNGVWKWDCGTESKTDAEKGESSDAFKRAAVKWGIGRYLYSLPKINVQISSTGANWIKIIDKATKQEVSGYYSTPVLPDWAYPSKTNEEREKGKKDLIDKATKAYQSLKNPPDKVKEWQSQIDTFTNSQIVDYMKSIQKRIQEEAEGK